MLAHRTRRRLVTVLACLVPLATTATAAGCGAGTESGAPRVVTRGCPSVLPGTSNANEDFADLLVWGGRTYVAVDNAVPAAEPWRGPLRAVDGVGVVTCSLVDGPRRHVRERLANPPWPDGTATALTQGTTVYAVQDRPTGCALAARREGKLVGYVAIDTDDATWPRLC